MVIGVIGVLFFVNCEGAKTVSLFPSRGFY